MVTSAISGLLDLGAAGRTFTVNDGTANEELIVGAVIGSAAGAFGVTKAGRGTMTLTGTNTYSGATTLNTDSGTLLINGSVAAGSVTVNPNSTLGGTGTINGAVTLAAAGSNLLVGGILSPGTPSDDTGILTVNNAVTFNTGSAVQRRHRRRRAPNTDYDQLAVTGAVTINTGAVLTGSTPPKNLPNSGIIRIINHTTTAGTITGTFSNSIGLPGPNPLIVGGKTYTPDYATTVDGVGADLVLAPIVGMRVWDGDAADDNWSTDRNWVGDVSPFVGDELVFNDLGVLAGANPFNDLVAFVASKITLANITGSYDLLGNVVTVTNGVFSTEGATASNTITQGLTGTGALSKTGAGTLIIEGATRSPAAPPSRPAPSASAPAAPRGVWPEPSSTTQRWCSTGPMT